jgi:chromosome segregation ATPase
MAKEPNPKENTSDPLEGVADFDPDAIEEADVADAQVASEPVSPLGPPARVSDPGLSSIELLLKEANRRIEQLQADLTAEREQRQELEKKYFQTEALAAQAEKALTGLEEEKQKRQELERQIAVMETEIKHAQSKAELMEKEREARLDLERQINSVKFKAEQLPEVVEELAEERKARLALEREKASLEIEVQHARKLDQLLTEERQARANAQMRASSAESKLAQLEGELAAVKSKRSFWSRG